jgi:hypothetical protein
MDPLWLVDLKVMVIEEGRIESEAEMSLGIATSSAGGGRHSRDTKTYTLTTLNSLSNSN